MLLRSTLHLTSNPHLLNKWRNAKVCASYTNLMLRA
jgi:hypothetical protein